MAEVDERITEKIKRLLALSDSSNVHEAQLAAAKAAELMARYHLSRDALHYEKTGHEVIHKAFDTSKGQAHIGGGDWMRLLFGRLSAVFYCKMIYVSDTGKWGGNTVIIGRENDIEAVKAMYDWIRDQIVVLSLEIEYPRKVHREKFREDWFIGIVDGIYWKMKEFSDVESRKFQQAGAIVRVIDDQNDQKAKELFPNLGSHLVKRAGAGYSVGQKAAAKVQVHESVGGSSNSGLGSGVKKLGSG